MRKKLVLFAVILACCGGSTKAAFAWVTCFCEVATAFSNGEHNEGKLNLTDAVFTQYNGCLDPWWDGEQCSANISDCSRRCNNACGGYVKSQSLADSLCAQGVSDGSDLRCYSHVGTRKDWQVNQTIGILTNIAAVSNTVCTCPKPWLNNENVVGGTTGPDKFCKIGVCGPITPGPGTSLPANGTGTNTTPNWWTWGNGLYESAPVANCVATPIRVARCSFLGPGTWTGWFNSDNDGGAGDYELLQGLVDSKKVCAKPLAIECQTAPGIDWTKAQLVYHCDLSKGGYCVNAEQGAGKSCVDFKVRFLCS
jgi:hypothetical protein